MTNLLEVREAASRVNRGWHSRLISDSEIVCDFVLSIIDPEPDLPITAEWLREEWGLYDTLSKDDVRYCYRNQENAELIVDMRQWQDVWVMDVPVWPHDLHTRQQFCDLARCLEIPRQKAKLEQSNESYCGKCGEKLKQTKKGVQYCECWMPTLGEDGAK